MLRVSLLVHALTVTLAVHNIRSILLQHHLLHQQHNILLMTEMMEELKAFLTREKDESRNHRLYEKDENKNHVHYRVGKLKKRMVVLYIEVVNSSIFSGSKIITKTVEENQKFEEDV